VFTKLGITSRRELSAALAELEPLIQAAARALARFHW
jgi:hypothetical protein